MALTFTQRSNQQPAPLAALFAGGTRSKKKRDRLHTTSKLLLKAAARVKRAGKHKESVLVAVTARRLKITKD